MKVRSFCVGFSLLVVGSAAAEATCTPVSKMSFSPVRNDVVQTTMNCDASGFSRDYKAGKDYKFTSVSIQSAAQGGNASAYNYGIKYKPKTGFKGSDSFAVRVCATRNSESGCSNITYIMQVN